MTDDEESIWDLPEDTRIEVIDKIEALAWDIRADWSDPRGACREIARLCGELREMEVN